jgi:Na+/H+ antiporter NhaD/arsenite permease-like protein
MARAPRGSEGSAGGIRGFRGCGLGEMSLRIAGVPVEFLLFALTLLGVAVFHRQTLRVALIGLSVIGVYKLVVSDGFSLAHHLESEWVGLTNLAGLILGFTLLADHFQQSRLPDAMPRYLPDDWKGGFLLLVLVAVMSSFLDNIAAAMIGATIATTVFAGRVHPMFLAALIAVSNAGGAGSVLGDTTTTMMWIRGVPPGAVLEAGLGAVVAVVVCGVVAARVQDKYQRILADPPETVRVDGARVLVVGVLLATTVVVNVASNVWYPGSGARFPLLAAALWGSIGLTALYRPPDWRLMPEAASGALFLLSLVASASLMPVSELPEPSWATAFGLGFVSSIFDNIPLTALALRQGGYDWGFVAWAVGFGGSMMWFGSSAGVAVANRFPEIRSSRLYLRNAWPVIIAYVAGFFVMYGVLGWHPDPHASDRPVRVHSSEPTSPP